MGTFIAIFGKVLILLENGDYNVNRMHYDVYDNPVYRSDHLVFSTKEPIDLLHVEMHHVPRIGESLQLSVLFKELTLLVRDVVYKIIGNNSEGRISITVDPIICTIPKELYMEVFTYKHEARIENGIEYLKYAESYNDWIQDIHAVLKYYYHNLPDYERLKLSDSHCVLKK